METKLPFTVATGIDDNYVLPFLVMIYSAKVNTSEKFHVKVGFDSRALSAKNRELLAQVLRLIDVPFEFVKLTLSKDMKARGHISSTSYARLLLADQFSGLMLWLDCDLICLPGWDSIFMAEENLPGGMVMSVTRDAYVSTKGINYFSQSNNESIRVMGPDYFNAGVALIDCDIWKSRNYSKLWPTVLMEADIRGFEYADQCVLNFLCKGQVNYLPWQYNALGAAKSHNKKKHPLILHFAGGLKPWTYAMLDSRILKGELFFSDVYKYRRYQSSMIKMIRLKNRTLASTLIVEKKRIRVPFRFSRMDLNRELFHKLRSKFRSQ